MFQENQMRGLKGKSSCGRDTIGGSPLSSVPVLKERYKQIAVRSIDSIPGAHQQFSFRYHLNISKFHSTKTVTQNKYTYV